MSGEVFLNGYFCKNESVVMCACVKGSYITCALSLCWQAVISRGNLMKQAEKLIDDLGWSKAVLEIQYEDEVCMCVCVCVVLLGVPSVNE